MVCGGPALKLVLPEELELIICGRCVGPHPNHFSLFELNN